jgi:hypothetical protein
MDATTQTGVSMITNTMIAKALESFIENFDENAKYLQGQRELHAECEARHKNCSKCGLVKNNHTEKRKYECKCQEVQI